MGAGMTMEGISELLQSSGPGIQQSAKTSNAPRFTIYGQSRVAGNCVYSASDGCHTYNQILVWASHPIKSVDHIYIQGKEVILSGTATGEGYKDDGQDHYDVAHQKYNFKGKLWVCNRTNSHWYRDLYNGLHSVTLADSNWDSSCTLANMASSYIASTYDANVFSGWPNVLAVIRGKCDIYDPRLGDRLNADGSINSATHIYTNNAALVIADFLTNNDFGCGIDWDSIDIPQLISAANICDEQVPLASGVGGANTNISTWQADRQYAMGAQVSVNINGTNYLQEVTGLLLNGLGSNTGLSGSSMPSFKTVTGQSVQDGWLTWSCQGASPTNWAATLQSEARYTVNGGFQWSSTPGENLSSLLNACEGRLTYTGGLFQIWPAAWYGSTLQFDQSDLVDNIKETSNRKFREKINCVRATFVCPGYPYSVSGYDQNHPDSSIYNGCWQPTDAPEYACDALHGYAEDIYMTQDGGIKLPTDRRYQFVTSVSQAQRLSKIFLLRNRYQGTYTLSMSLAAYQTRPVDVIQMTIPALNWTNKLLEVNTLKFVQQQGQSQSGQGAPSLSVQLECSETDPSIYDWSVAEEMTQEARQSPAAWEANEVADPTNLVIESGLDSAVVGTDGTVTPRILVTWTEPNDPFTVTGGYIEVQWWTDDAPSTIYNSGQLSGDTTAYYISGVKQGQGVSVQIRASHMNRAVGNWVGPQHVIVDTTTSQFGSTVLNNQGSIAPSQPITYTSAGLITKSQVGISWTQQSLLRPDGTTLTLQAGSQVYSGLSSSTTYYLYPYITVASGLMGFANGNPPPTSPSSLMAAQAAQDGQIYIGSSIAITTLASTNGGTGGSGGGGGCPEANELVDVKGKGQVKASEVEAGDYIKGKCFKTGEDVYRRVLQVSYQALSAWRMIDGHRNSPCESVYYSDQWLPAFRVPCSTLDTTVGTKAMISVEADEYGEHNFYLVSGTPLLIHNMMVGS